jgi:hypothetical protein
MTRGLSSRENNHFISVSEEFIKLYRIMNDDEYNIDKHRFSIYELR